MLTDAQSQSQSNTKVPAHVAIIMDGNGRWAQQRGEERSAGHAEGVNTVKRITEAASNAGVKHLTLYTFSTENWNRPAAEVAMLMHLMVQAVVRETPDLLSKNVRLTVIGDLDTLPPETRASLEQCIADTAHCTGINLNLAISYSARWELTRAMRQIASEVADGKLQPADITDATISDRLATAGIPDPDLLIRTGGEHRISNFLLWQIAYSEIYVTDVLWPDFTAHEFDLALADYARRQRRFGLTGEQVTAPSN